MQLINSISHVEQVVALKPMNSNDQEHKRNEFSQLYDKECSKRKPKEIPAEAKQDVGELKIIARDGEFETYTNLARPAYLYMQIATTDLKG